MPSNEERCERVSQLLSLYWTLCGKHGDEATLGDILTDMRHYAHAKRGEDAINFGKILRRSVDDFRAERDGDPGADERNEGVIFCDSTSDPECVGSIRHSDVGDDSKSLAEITKFVREHGWDARPEFEDRPDDTWLYTCPHCRTDHTNVKRVLVEYDDVSELSEVFVPPGVEVEIRRYDEFLDRSPGHVVSVDQNGDFCSRRVFRSGGQAAETLSGPFSTQDDEWVGKKK